MPLDLAAALRHRLTERFPPSRAYPRAAFHAEGMPPLIAAFLDRALDRWVEIERVQFRSDWFDYDDAAVARTEASFFGALRRAARIPAGAWTDTLGGSVDLVVRFLTTPARALTDAIFEGETDPLPTEEVRERLPMFDAYPYLPEVALAYLDRKQPPTLTPTTLFALLDRIDRRVVQEYGLSDWLTLLAPLVRLADYADLDGLPTHLLERFFEAKGADDLAECVASHDGATLDTAQIRDVLAPAFPATPDGPAAARRPSPESFDDEALEPEDSATEKEPEDLKDPVHPEDLILTPSPSDDELADDLIEDEDENDASTSYAFAAELPPVALDPIRDEPEDEASEAPDKPRASGAETDAETGPARPSAAKPSFDAETGDEPEDAESESEEPTASASDDDEVDRAPLPLWQRFAAGSDGDSVNARFGTSESGPHDAEGDASDAVPLWKRFFGRPDEESSAVGEDYPVETAAEAAPLRPADTLEALESRVLGPMPPSQRKRFVKQLFGGDAGKYATVLHALDRASSWTEASQIIARDVFRPSRVNIYGDHAIAFTDAVESRYRD